MLVFYCNPLSLSLYLTFNQKIMFGLFKKKSEKDKLFELYDKKKKEAFILSKSNRKESDRLEKEAFDVLQKIEAIEAKEQGSK